MITIIAIIIAIIITVYLSLRDFLYLLLLLLICYIIYRIIKENKNNKKYHHSLFKERKHITDLDLVISFINQVDFYKNIIIDGNNIIVIINSGIYFIKVTNYSHLITGDIQDDFFTKQDENGKSKVFNVLKNYDNEFNKYQSKTEEKINKYLIYKNSCNFNVNYHDIRAINMKTAYFEFKKLSQNTIYNKGMIDDLYKKLNNM